MPPPLYFNRLRKRPAQPTQKVLDDRAVRQSEDYYKRSHYSDESVERNAEMDFQLGQALKKRRRGLRGVKITGMEN